jgi:tight adherence protein B
MEIAIVAVVLGLIGWLFIGIWNKRSEKGAEESFTTVDEVEQKPIIKPRDNGLIDYSIYKMSLSEMIATVVIAGSVFFVVGYIFYMNAIIALIFALLGLLYPKIRKRQMIAKRKQALTIQFKQALYTLSSSLAAGKSMENAFREATQDLYMLYFNPQTFIILEFEIINRRVENGEPIELGLIDFNERAGIDDLANFTDVFVTCKRSGGDLIDVIRKTSNLIGDKLEIKQDIAVMMAQKRFESRALSVIPIALIALLGFGSKDYMAPMYTGIGYLIMTFALLLFMFCLWLIQKIMDIKV